MTISITADDLRRGEEYFKQKHAKDEYGNRIWHVWKNPISIAVERSLGRNALCTVSPKFISLASRLGGNGQRIPITTALSVFMEEWKRAVAQPMTFMVDLTF